MDAFVMQANHNMDFHDMVCGQVPDKFYDWKITCLFYVAIHYLKALASKRKKNIGTYHHEINRNIKSGNHNPAMPISTTACDNYMNLFHYSQSARYDGFEDFAAFNDMKKADYEHALKCFTDFEKFIVSNGIKIKPEKPVSKAQIGEVPTDKTPTV